MPQTIPKVENRLHRALFIVFEGIDGSGTTTQSKLLARYMEEELGIHPVYTREPGGTLLAEKIRDLVLDPDTEEVNLETELFLYAASRAQHVDRVIRPAFQGGKPVICDRFTSSTLAYQGYGRGLDLEMVLKVNAWAVRGCWPDTTIFLDLPVEEAVNRRRKRIGRPDRLEEEGNDFQEKVRTGYLEIARKNQENSLVLDATLSCQDLAEATRAELWTRWPKFPLKE